ncbi:ankyrin repeat-containing domain protein [Cercophora newfieldiana]|uniref:Ankyrin repeat-containing domain protein n=1 Tax=Cercophora newfieldiana TaxID=92897 RepID=A0AA39YJ53_9PEZI|nr:ankyrin repeat-containing domain protein [Cercophora newfieldiana]
MEAAFAIVGAADVAVRATCKLWALSDAWRDAPADLFKLRDDLTRTERFYAEIQQHVTNSRSSALGASYLRQDLQSMIEEGAITLRQIEAIVDGLVAPGNDGPDEKHCKNDAAGVGKRRKLRWLKQSAKVTRLRKELAHTRSNICQLLITQNISMSREIDTSLDVTQRELTSQMQRLSTSLVASQYTLLAQMDNRFRALESTLLAVPSPTAPSNGKDLMDAFNTPRPPAPAPFDAPAKRASFCDISCTCTCHRATQNTWMRITLLWSIAGVMAVSTSGRGSQSCTNPHCRDSKQGQSQPFRDVHIIYHLPDWLARTTISAFFSTNLNGSPQMNLRVHNRRNFQDLWGPRGIGQYIELSDTEGVKSLLRSGDTSVYDVFGPTQWPALWWAFNNGVRTHNLSIIKLLLQAGADPFQRLEAAHNRSVMTVAFQVYTANDPKDRDLATVLPIAKYLDDSDLSPVHLAILNITHVSLAELLPSHLDKINTPNIDGFTPLHVAAIRGDADSAKVLIRYGAELEALSTFRNTPLYYACAYGHYQVASLLLQAGANVHARDLVDRQPIHAAAAHDSSLPGASTDLVSLLLQYDADVNSEVPDVGNPLQYAVFSGSTDTAKALLDWGAEAKSAILTSIHKCRHEMARLLLSYKVDLSCVDEDDNQSVLHNLALTGDEEMMLIFAQEFRRRGGGEVNTGSKDAQGKTAATLFEERGPTQELRNAFQGLLDAVDGDFDGEEAADPELKGVEEEEEIFWDAEDGFTSAEVKEE